MMKYVARALFLPVLLPVLVTVQASAQDACTDPVAANDFINYAASKGNNFSIGGQSPDEGDGSCVIYGATALASASAGNEKICYFNILSKELNEGWRLADVDFFKSTQHANLTWDGGHVFELKAAPGTSSLVTLISVTLCTDQEDIDTWKDAF